MIIYLFDGSTYTVSPERGKAVNLAVNSGFEWIDLGDIKIRTSSISKLDIKHEPKAIKQPLLVAPTTELTDEQRQANVARIQAMRVDYHKRLLKK